MKKSVLPIALICAALAFVLGGFQNMTPVMPLTAPAVCGRGPGLGNQTPVLPTQASIYNLTRIKENWGQKSAAGFVCPATPVAPTKFDPPDFYLADKVTRNPANTEYLQPWKDYVSKVNELSDLYLATQSPAVRDCALNWLYAWSRSGTLDESTDYSINYTAYSFNQGEYERSHLPVALIASYLKIKSPGLNATQVEAFRNWMAGTLKPVRAFYARREKNAADRNNHSYWAGLGQLLYAVAFDNINSTEGQWGIARFKMGALSIASNGTLPNELSRGSKSAIYHQYAMSPLVMMAEVAHRQGVDLYSYNGSSINRLKNLIVRYYDNPAMMEILAMAVQSDTPGVFLVAQPGYLHWMEVWHARFGSRDLEPLIAKMRYHGRLYKKDNMRELGGDFTLAFGVSDCHLPMISVDKQEYLLSDMSCQATTAASCSLTKYCPTGYHVESAKAVCDVFDIGVPVSSYDATTWGQVNGYRARIGSNYCQLAGLKVLSGIQSVILPMSRGVVAGCGASSAGTDCEMRGQVLCTKNY